MTRALVCLSLFCLAGCNEKTAGPPPAQPIPHLSPEKQAEAAANDDVQNFLKGMLIVSNVKPPRDPIWPASDESSTHWWWVKGHLKWGWGFEKPEQFVDAINEQDEHNLTRSDLWLRSNVSDEVSVLPGWQKLLERNPKDCEAAMAIAWSAPRVFGPKVALEMLAKADPVDAPKTKQTAGCSRSRFFSVKGALFFRNHQLDEALEAAQRAEQLDENHGARVVAKVLLAQGKKKEALVEAQRAANVPDRKDPGAAFTLGFTQQQLGDDEAAKKTWADALERWPGSTILISALAGTRRSLFEWEEEEQQLERREIAKNLSFCGGSYAEFGLKDRSEACYREAERLEPGAGLARQLVFLGLKKPDDALEKLAAATRPDSSIELMTAYGWILLRQKRVADAEVWVNRALAVEPRDAKAMSLKWQICGEEKDYLCVIEYRRNLGLPTHFNQEQYSDAAKAFKEQAEKNGEGLAAKEPSSADVEKPPKVKELVLVPLGDRVPPELDGLEKGLANRLQGMKVSVADREDLPAGAYSIERDQVIWERLLPKLREEPGRIYVLERDLGSANHPFSFARFDLPHGRAVLSVSRLRSLTGKPTAASTTLDADLLPAAQRRLGSLTLGVAGALLGLSYPCDEKRCAMRERRAVSDLAVTSPPFCAEHTKQPAQALAASPSK